MSLKRKKGTNTLIKVKGKNALCSTCPSAHDWDYYYPQLYIDGAQIIYDTSVSNQIEDFDYYIDDRVKWWEADDRVERATISCYEWDWDTYSGVLRWVIEVSKKYGLRGEWDIQSITGTPPGEVIFEYSKDPATPKEGDMFIYDWVISYSVLLWPPCAAGQENDSVESNPDEGTCTTGSYWNHFPSTSVGPYFGDCAHRHAHPVADYDRYWGWADVFDLELDSSGGPEGSYMLSSVDAHTDVSNGVGAVIDSTVFEDGISGILKTEYYQILMEEYEPPRIKECRAWISSQSVDTVWGSLPTR